MLKRGLGVVDCLKMAPTDSCIRIFGPSLIETSGEGLGGTALEEKCHWGRAVFEVSKAHTILY